MAALDFPSSPAVGQTYTANGKTWQWDGVSWLAGGSGLAVLSLAYAATVNVDLTAYTACPTVHVNIGTLTGPVTFNISNGFDAQVVRVTFTQDATGGRLFTAGANFAFSADLPSITLSTAANKSDEIAWRWHSASGKARAIAINKGF